MEEPYSSREIASMFKAQDERADEFHASLLEKMDRFENDTRDSLSRIELQTTKTNGRVTDIEKRQNKSERWQSYVVGFCACLSLLLVPVLLAFILSYLKLVH